MISFYHAYYKRQIKEEDGFWHDTMYDHQGIVVIAENYNEAECKILQCLNKVEIGCFRAVLVSPITEAIGIDLSHGFDDSLYISPITEN